MNITVVGTGYVGLSNSILLAQHNRVVALDIDQHKVDLINSKKSPLVDAEIQEYLASKSLDLVATTDKSLAYSLCDFVIVATPTDYDTEQNFFNTASVESVIAQVQELAPHATVIIKSTIPVGFTQRMRDRSQNLKSFFPQNSFGKVGPCTTICIHLALLLEIPVPKLSSLRPFCRAVL